MPQEPALDPDAIAALKAVSPDDGGAFLKELIDIFLTDTPLRLQEVAQSLQTNDGPTLVRAAHSIKGAAGNFGARQLADVAHRVEQIAKQGRLDEVRAALPGLEQEFMRVKAEMEALRAH